MLTQDMLFEYTESYLKSVVAEAALTPGSDFDASTPFGDLGIDSFRVLKIIKALESEFGTLPKTLLFENFDIDSLARYFVGQHAHTLRAKFAPSESTSPRSGGSDRAPEIVAPLRAVPPEPSVSSTSVQPIRVLEKDLPRYPELEALVAKLYEHHKNEGCVSRGTRNIAPNLFIGGARKGYFNYSRSRDALLVYAYTGPEDYFAELAAEMHRYCQDKRFQLNIFVDKVLGSIAGVPFSSTPFGALQRVLGIRSFSLEGGAMRRLRYQVSKFEKAGVCRTQEYKCGSDPSVDRDIAAIIDRWCETKTMVNPLIHMVKDETLAGTLHPQHRIFLTYLDDALQNVILISAMCRDLNGYLMDLEFYPKDMPQGGLEYAIVNIIGTLAGEGCDMLSLGGTYGCRLTTSETADPELDRILDELHRQNIFNDESNLQFKNKFRPENRTIYICRPAGCGNADNVIDIIMMIADPAKAQTPDDENHNVAEVLGGIGAAETTARVAASSPVSAALIEGEARSRDLVEFGFNPFNLPAERIEFDLKTDSWAQLDTPYVAKQMKHLRAQLQQPVALNEGFQSVFPFKHFVLTEAGRSAEHVFCKAWPKKGIVLQNLLFPTGIFHQIDKGFTPCELPSSALFDLASEHGFKGEPNWDSVQEQVALRASEIAYVCVEVGNNAAGGQPVSTRYLRQLRELLASHSIPLVIDATRILDNACLLIEREAEHTGKTIWEVARETLAYADVVIGSLAKNFCVAKGGFIATRDEILLRRFQEVIQQEGGGLDIFDKKLVAVSLANPKVIEALVLRRCESVKTVWNALAARGVPVARPFGGHCVLIDVKRIPAFASFTQPVASFLAWLYLHTGIRGGAHSVGMQKGTSLDGLVRLAIPVGLKPEQAVELATRIVGAFAEMRNVPELTLTSGANESFGDIHAEYTLVRYHNPSGVIAAEPTSAPPQRVEAPAVPVRLAPAIASIPVSQVPVAEPIASAQSATRGADIAVVGMAGRYPKARDLVEFWDNLRQGRDCVGDLPEARMAWRADNALTRRYRGAFIDDVDKFDSLFFNISPREAEALDPQERLFLEVAWETLEDAGYYPEILVGENEARNVGVFVGAVWAMYQIVGVEEKLAGRDASPNSFLWSIANRVSYWMNLTGPSLTVDTACSSSLTALYLACEAIRNGDCSSALVGGVNLDLHQHKFDINRAGGALSPDGVCRSFGADANGYVAGEGVGAIFLKPLHRALEDRDQIYGVIKSATSNHGGRTSGYTVPNPKAQGELIGMALARAGVDARGIGYIEAHGTGTELGDPVEISGLVNAFEKHGVALQSCPIGSVKTNIGHLEAAAGVVSVTKVLLQMRYRQLVPSLHSERLNEHIDFGATPFFVQRRLETWRPPEVDGCMLPLRAGVSSFGAGGANAHVVIEQVPRSDQTSDATSIVPVFPLSARTEEQLRQMAARLRAHLDLDFVEHRLDDIAFTLQHGRKSFEHRLAIVAHTPRGLAEKLDAFLAGRSDADVIVGHAKNAEGITRMLSRKEREQFVSLLAQSRDPHKLAQLWIDGLLSDCRGFPRGAGRRTSLPTYPFADKRHWIGSARGAASVSPLQQIGPALHPMIDSNESTFHRQLFRKRFHAREFFLDEHRVSGIPTLPGTAYLDLARKAGEIASGRRVARIRNLTWVSPLAVEGNVPLDAQIELKPGPESVLFEVFSLDAAGKRTLYAQGRLILAQEGEAQPAPEYVDLGAIRARCARVLSGEEAYPLFESVGLRYGPSFQLLREVGRNDDEVLGLLALPDVRATDFDQFVLHPCILDAAMQAGVASQLGDAGGQMKVPYSIGEIEILAPLTRLCYSHVTRDRSARGGAGLSRENVCIVDEQGRVLARIRDSIGVPLASVHGESQVLPQTAAAPSVAPAPSEDSFVPLYYAPTWEVSPLARLDADVASLVLFDVDDRLRDACQSGGRRVFLVVPGESYAQLDERTYVIDPAKREDYLRLFEALGEQGALGKICYAWADSVVPEDHDTLAAALQNGVHSFFLLCQTLSEARKLWTKAQLVYLYFARQDAPQPHNQAIAGFARSLHLEMPQLDCKLLEIQQDDPRDRLASRELADWLIAELHAGAQARDAVRYAKRTRYTRTLEQLAPARLGGGETPGLALRQRGVYLITGGVGGLGLIFAEHLARQCGARLVLTGRSELTAERVAQLDALRGLGAEVHYVAADVARPEDVARLLAETRGRFGALHGIVHGAGVLRDAYLGKKTPEDFAAVCAPKVYGAFHLDRQTRNDALDFFVMFSSLASFGNVGQCDYAFANHYLDSFAAERELRRAEGLRSGKSLSLNWSLWAEGGMKIDAATEAFFKKQLGIKPLSRAFGLEAFGRGLLASHAQLAVLEGNAARIESAWGLRPETTAAVRQASSARAGAGEDFAGAVTQTLSSTVMELLKLSADDLSLDSVLTDLGFDSVGLMSFANAINDAYGLDINPTLFFEYPSIRAISGVLVAEHGEAVRKRHGGAVVATPARASAAAAAVDGGAGDSFVIDKGWRAAPETPPAGGDFSRQDRFLDMPIAIVGIGGVMPQSANLEEFWEGLRDGRNMVSEIPRDRWTWEDYDGNPVKEVNKSNSRWGGFLKDIDKFDPLFFGITPREAEMMDPQQRLFIETVWSAIEDAGHKVSDLAGTRTGLFVGVSAKDYVDVLAENEATLDGFSASGNSHSILANRVSFLLNLRGPSAPLDTACSSSLIALHRAIESIHTGSSDMAIVGGVQVMLTPVGHISLSSAGMLSVDGKCKTFDKDANGYVRGEGSGAIFIKPLAQAERDGNPIYAVVKATAENHGGRVTMLTAPNPKAQAELLLEAYDKAQVDPATIGYIECHGTGTSLGDPIEIQALKKSFSDLYKKHGRSAPSAPHCGLSSVKTNIGHLEPAAGIASLLKVLLSIKHRQIPALLHFETLNPYIDLAGSPFYIVDKTRPWDPVPDRDGAPLPRRAGVSSFGWGGANAHVVLEEYVAPAPLPEASGPHLVLLSAKNEPRLKAYAEALLAHLHTHSPRLDEVAYTLQVGRDPMEERLALAVESVAELMDKLVAFVAGESAIDGLQRGQINRYRRNERGLSDLDHDSEASQARRDIEEAIARRDHAHLLQAWVGGAEIDWNAWHGARKPRRVSLPTYPFARDRHWIAPASTRRKAQAGASAAALHPLIHDNLSTLARHRYGARFSGREFFLAAGAAGLPAAVCLEMARAAVAFAKPMSEPSQCVELGELVWPVVEGRVAGRALRVDVFETRDGRVGYDIRSGETSSAELALQNSYCRGFARFVRRPAEARLDPTQLRALMNRGALDATRREALPSGLAELRRGYRQALLRLVLPAELIGTRDDYLLHPALFEGLLQGASLVASETEPVPPRALSSLQVLSSCGAEMLAWVRPARGSDAHAELLLLDVDVMSPEGVVCLRLSGLAFANPDFRAAPSGDADIAALLDSIYDTKTDAPASPLDEGASPKDEFQKILEEIL